MMIVDVYLTIVIILGTNDRRSITDDLAVEGNILRSHDSSRYHEVGAKLLFTRQRWLELRDMKHLQKSQDKWVAIDPIFLVIWGWPSVHPSSDGKSIVPMLDPSAVRILRRYRDCQTLVPSFLPSWLFHSLRIILEYLSLGVGHSNMEVCWITVKMQEVTECRSNQNRARSISSWYEGTWHLSWTWQQTGCLFFNRFPTDGTCFRDFKAENPLGSVTVREVDNFRILHRCCRWESWRTTDTFLWVSRPFSWRGCCETISLLYSCFLLFSPLASNLELFSLLMFHLPGKKNINS